jgi:hypothetical protein
MRHLDGSIVFWDLQSPVGYFAAKTATDIKTGQHPDDRPALTGGGIAATATEATGRSARYVPVRGSSPRRTDQRGRTAAVICGFERHRRPAHGLRRSVCERF